jgi:hypothetical protein
MLFVKSGKCGRNRASFQTISRKKCKVQHNSVGIFYKQKPCSLLLRKNASNFTTILVGSYIAKIIKNFMLMEENKMNRLLMTAVLLIATLFATGFWIEKAGATTLTSSQDAMITDGGIYAEEDHSDLRDTNCGAWDTITVNWLYGFQNYGLVQFDLSGISGVSAIQAQLDLYHLYNSVPGASFALYRVTSPWNESTVTWNSAPSIDTSPVSVLNISDSDAEIWRHWDVTDLVQGWLDGTYENFGLMLARLDTLNPVAYFASKEHGIDYAPTLSIDQDQAAVPEPSTFILLGTGLVGICFLRRKMKA